MRARVLVILAAVLAVGALVHEVYGPPVRLPREAVLAAVMASALCLLAAGAVHKDDKTLS